MSSLMSSKRVLMIICLSAFFFFILAAILEILASKAIGGTLFCSYLVIGSDTRHKCLGISLSSSSETGLIIEVLGAVFCFILAVFSIMLILKAISRATY